MLRTSVLIAITLAGLEPALASEVGLVGGTFAATYEQQDVGCAGLLITGQFIAPTPGYTLSLAEVPAETTITMLAMKLTATPSPDIAPQVLTPTAVVHSDPTFSDCPYGVSISYEKQSLIVPFTPAFAVRSGQ